MADTTDTPVLFSESDGQRIADVVGIVENWPRKTTGRERRYYDRPESTRLVQITAACEGKGKYAGKVIAGQINASATATDLSMPEGLEQFDACTVYHLDGSAGHRLAVGSYILGMIFGVDADNVPIVIADAGTPKIWQSGNPYVARMVEGDGTNVNYDSSWTRDVSGPLELDVVCGVGFNSTTHILTAYYRTLSFDASGRLTSASAGSGGDPSLDVPIDLSSLV